MKEQPEKIAEVASRALDQLRTKESSVRSEVAAWNLYLPVR